MPFDPVLTLETAALLLVAFLVGATVGSLLRVAVLRAGKAPTVAVAAVAAHSASPVEALVATPVIAPLAVPRPPLVPKEIEAPDFAAAVAAPPPVLELAPARKPGIATAGRDVGRPDRNLPLATKETAPAVENAEPSLRIDPAPVVIDEALPPLATSSAAETVPPNDHSIADAVGDKSEAAPTAELAQPDAEVTSELPAVAPVSELPPIEPLGFDPELSAADAEAAAMRAIEGSWTPGRRPQPAGAQTEPVAKVAESMAEAPFETPPAPATDTLEPVVEVAMLSVEPIVVVEAESGGAPAGEVGAVGVVPDVLPQDETDRIVPADRSDEPEQEPELLPRLGPEPALIGNVVPVGQPSVEQPPGVGAPRHGMRDDLTQIVGVLPVVETTLNRLGIYHFDQVAEWTDAHAGWVESHLGIAGRVDREHWREQARELAAIASGKQPSRKKRPS